MLSNIPKLPFVIPNTITRSRDSDLDLLNYITRNMIDTVNLTSKIDALIADISEVNMRC